MAKAGINTGFAKCFILFMAVIILVQGGVYFGLAIWGITQENCSGTNLDFVNNPFRTVLDLVYFIRQDCGDVTLTVPNQEDVPLTIDWSQSFTVTNRTYIFLITYAVISGLWVIGSLLVIATICGPVTKLVSAFCFWPWFCFVIAGSILDVVATGFHIRDLVGTTSATQTFSYIGIQSLSADVINYLQDYDVYFIAPSVVMTCVSSRVILIWLLNIVGTSFCLSLSRVLWIQRRHNKHHSNHEITSQVDQDAPSQIVEYSSPKSRSPRLDITAQTVQRQQQIQRQASSQAQAQAQAMYSPNAPPQTPDVIVVESVRLQNGNRNPSSSVVLSDDITYRKTDSHPDRLDYPPKTPLTPSQLSASSLLNSRYSTVEVGISPSPNQHPQRVSEELRGQLPWSYTSMVGKPQPPRKPQSKAYPDIPEPDYNDQNNSVQQQQSGPASGILRDADHQRAYSRW